MHSDISHDRTLRRCWTYARFHEIGHMLGDDTTTAIPRLKAHLCATTSYHTNEWSYLPAYYTHNATLKLATGRQKPPSHRYYPTTTIPRCASYNAN